MAYHNWPAIGAELYLEVQRKFPNDPQKIRAVLLVLQGEFLRLKMNDKGAEAFQIGREWIGKFGLDGASAALHEALPHSKRAEKLARDKEKLKIKN